MPPSETGFRIGPQYFLGELRDEVRALAEAQRGLTETVGRLAHDVAALKGVSLETHYLLRAAHGAGPGADRAGTAAARAGRRGGGAAGAGGGGPGR